MVDHNAVWSALSHPARRRLLERLRDGPALTGELHAHLATSGDSPSRFATQRHLQTLREAGLVSVTERGRERVNVLNGSTLYRATVGWLDPASRSVAESLDTIRHLAEKPIANTRKESTMTQPPIRHLLVEQSTDIAAPPDRAWQALTTDTRRWWRPPFTLLSDADDVDLEIPAEVGAPVLERDGDRTAFWGTLIERQDGRALAWSSRICGADAAIGAVRVRVEPTPAGCTVTFRQEAIGAFDTQTDDDVALGWRTKLDDLGVLLTGAPVG